MARTELTPQEAQATALGDYKFGFHDDFEPVVNSIGQNQTRVREDHLVMQAILPAP